MPRKLQEVVQLKFYHICHFSSEFKILFLLHTFHPEQSTIQDTMGSHHVLREK